LVWHPWDRGTQQSLIWVGFMINITYC
jgi:hypothetical protein